MTIALGLIAEDGIVIAADRQETEGDQKTDQGKIDSAWTLPDGALLVTGAGNGPYIDSVSRQLKQYFSGTEERDEDALTENFTAIHRAFYSETVLPFANYHPHERPDYELLLGCSTNRRCSLWYSQKLALNLAEGFRAVGIGASAAESFLKKFYVLRLPLKIAVSLAVFVIHQVKNSVEGCGFETDVLCIGNRVPRIPLRVSPHEIRKMEDAFKKFREVERDDLYQMIGGDLVPKNRNAKNWNQCRRELRRTFTKFYDSLGPPFNAEKTD